MKYHLKVTPNTFGVIQHIIIILACSHQRTILSWRVATSELSYLDPTECPFSNQRGPSTGGGGRALGRELGALV
jgi:hypothetical protein